MVNISTGMTPIIEKDFSLLIVDMWWEEEIKARERGFAVHFNGFSRIYEQQEYQTYLPSLQYPFGTLHAGLDAIHDVVRMAHLLKKQIYGVVSWDSCSPPEEVLDKSLHPYVLRQNLFMKSGYSAFSSKDLTKRLEEDKVTRLMIMSFDRDCCVLETIRDAVTQGIEVITGEVLMLTCNRKDRKIALDFYRQNTTYLESLVDVFNYLDPEGKLAFTP